MLKQTLRSALALLPLLAALCLPVSSLKADPVNVLTYHYDSARTGANTSETILTPQNVNSAGFGRLFSHAVDGQVYAQPLYVANVSVPGKGVHNLLLVATQHDGVYAFDADNSAGANSAPLWQRSFLDPANGITSVPNNDTGTEDVTVEIGITGTPVIGLGSPDANGHATGTMYLVAKTKEAGSGVAHYVQRLHALDVTTGQDLATSPVVIGDTTTENNPPAGTPTDGQYSYYSGPYVPGSGAGFVTVNGQNRVYFNALREAQRPGLVLVGSRVYVSYASHGDNGPYHGWVLTYDANTLAPGAVYNTCPNGGLTGIWMSGEAPAVDAAGNLFFITGNGGFDANNTDTSTMDYGDSFLRLQPDLSFANPSANHSKDFFSPGNQANLNAGDVDVGSGGLVLLPDSVGSTAHPHLLVGCGKEGKIYLIDRDNLGGFNAGSDQVVQEFNGEGTWSSPAYWNGAIYYQGAGGALKRYPISNGVVDTNNVLQSGDGSGFPGSTPTISASGATNGIVWTIQSDAYNGNNPGQAILHAHDALNPNGELYNTRQNAARDNPGIACKFTVPVVTNGKVYVGTQNQISAYGLNPPALTAAPVITSNGQGYVGDQVTITDATPSASLYYTTDGTDPTASSTLYVAPFVVNGCETIKAKAYVAGDLDSAITSRFFGLLGTVGHGNGLAATYFHGVALDPNDAGGPPISEIDPFIDYSKPNFPFPASFANPQDQFSARWIGQVQPEFTDTYTFTTVSDDGIRMWVNGQEIINDFNFHGATTDTGAVALQAGQRYDIKVEFFQGGGGADAHLYWSSACQALQVIPTSQLYAGAPDTPTGLTAIGQNAKVALSWTASPGASSYVVKRGTTKGGPYTALTPAAPITGPSYVDTGLVNGTTYYYVVDAVNNAGPSADSGQASATPTSAPPGVPTGLTATAVSSSEIDLAWTNTDNAQTSLKLERSTDGGTTFAPYQTLAANATQYPDTGLPPSTTYVYRIKASNANGDSLPSLTATATTKGLPSTLTVANAKGAYGQTVTLSATLQAPGSGPGGKTLTFGIDGNTVGTAVTNDSGVATLPYAVTGVLYFGYGHPITVTFAGDRADGASSGAGTLTVIRANTALSVTGMTGAYGQALTLTATLTRTTDGTALSGRTVGFTVAGVQVGTAVTSATGVASRSYVVPNSLTLGAHPVAASFADNGGYLASSGAGTLTVAKAGASLTVPAVSGARGATVTLTATLRRATDGALMANRAVTFTVDGKAAGMAVTNASGVASRSYTIPPSATVGGHPISAGYAGDGTTLTGTGSGTLTVH